MYSTLICGRPSHAYVTTFLITDGACGRRITTSAATQMVGSEHSSTVRQLLFMARAPSKASSESPDGPGQLDSSTYSRREVVYRTGGSAAFANWRRAAVSSS